MATAWTLLGIALFFVLQGHSDTQVDVYWTFQVPLDALLAYSSWRVFRIATGAIRRFWRFYLPLSIDVLPVGIAWIIVPSQFHAPIETIALFAPDAFIVIATLTAFSIGWAMVRSFCGSICPDGPCRASSM